MSDATGAAPVAGAATGARKRDPHYDVFELVDLQQPGQEWAAEVREGEEPPNPMHGYTPGPAVKAWVTLATDVAAKSDREAIDRALDQAGRHEHEQRKGTFAAPLVGKFIARTKGTRTETTEVWT